MADDDPISPLTTTGCDRDRWGTDIEAQLLVWFLTVFLPMFHKRFDKQARDATGRPAEIAVVILDSGEPHDWRSPLDNIAHLLRSSHEASMFDRFFGPVGIFANICGKLAFTLREKLDSVFAEKRPDLLRPGDFPHQGAGTYRHYRGGASGLPNGADDWWCFKQVVDELIRLKREATRQALKDSKERKPGLKYLGANWFADMLRRIAAPRLPRHN